LDFHAVRFLSGFLRFEPVKVKVSAVLADDQERGRFLETLNSRKLGLGERALADGPSG
jgi:hypothetical protein